MQRRVLLPKYFSFARTVKLLAATLFCVFVFSSSPNFSNHSHQYGMNATLASIVCAATKTAANIPNRRPDCAKILKGDLKESCLWLNWHVPIVNESEIAKNADQCATYRLQFNSQPASDEEAGFPLAFSIGMHRDVAQFERLLRMIYWPQNIYCVHVDRKASESVYRAVQTIANCFENVFLTSRESVFWGGFSVLKASLNCAQDLLKSSVDWRYMINLAAQDVPLKTNGEMVRIFTILNGTNDVEMLPELHFKRYFYNHVVMRDENGVPFAHRPDYQSNKLPVPHDLRIYKGNFAASLSKAFVQFLFQDARAIDFTKWLQGTDTADEHLWSTINHNAALNAPGGYAGECHKTSVAKKWITRKVNWNTDESTACHGKFVRDVCIHGVLDLPHLIKQPHLFANKFYIDYQSAAYYCMEHYIKRRTQDANNERKLDYYRSLDAVVRANDDNLLCDHKALPLPSVQGAASVEKGSLYVF